VREVPIRDRRALLLVALAALVSLRWIGSWALGEAAWIRGIGLLKAGRDEAGLAALEETTRRIPDPSEALVELGHAMLRKGLYDRAIPVLERAAAVYRYAEPRAGLALALRAKGDAAGAERELRLALQIDRSDVRTRSDLAKLLLERAVSAVGRRHVAEAARAFGEADALLTPVVSRPGPYATTVNADLAVVRLYQKRSLEAVRLFRTARSQGPLDCQAWLNYAAACLEARQWGEAAEACRERRVICTDEPVERIGRIQHRLALVELSRELLATRSADPSQLPALVRELTEVGLAGEAAAIVQLERDLRAASRRD
jgi:tetratricopeptide (TPR) repeat protein